MAMRDREWGAPLGSRRRRSPRSAVEVDRTASVADVPLRPIAMFDSGFGGLTVARAVLDLLPHEQLVYLGDTGRYPYGPRALAEVRDFSVQIASYLVDRYDAKLVVVACNTATAAALDHLEEVLDVPVVGVIEPGVRALVSASDTDRVGIIGTVGTIGSGVYQSSLAESAPHVEVCALACPGFVEFVERGVVDGPQIEVLAGRMLAPALEAKIDALLLGCTHYPYLARVIADVMGRDVVLVSSADETAFEVLRLLEEGCIRRDPGGGPPVFLTTGDPGWFATVGAKLLGPELARAERVVL